MMSKGFNKIKSPGRRKLTKSKQSKHQLAQASPTTPNSFTRATRITKSQKLIWWHSEKAITSNRIRIRAPAKQPHRLWQVSWTLILIKLVKIKRTHLKIVDSWILDLSGLIWRNHLITRTCWHLEESSMMTYPVWGLARSICRQQWTAVLTLILGSRTASTRCKVVH